MPARWDPYNFKRTCEQRLAQLQKAPISQEAKKRILQFIDEASNGVDRPIGKARELTYLHYLRDAAVILGEKFLNPERPDIARLLKEWDSTTLTRGGRPDERVQKKPAIWTVMGRRAIIKRFYKWQLGNDEQSPPCVSWIKTSIRGAAKTNPEDLLDTDDVDKMIKGCLNSRDRAMISLLWDSGARIGEVLNLRVGDIKIETWGLTLKLSGKTGDRTVPVVGQSGSYIPLWLNDHPDPKEKSPLIVGIEQRIHGKPLDYASAAKAIRKAAMRGGVQKPVNPHNFRHSAATREASNPKIPMAAMEDYFGWTHGSRMGQVYITLSGRNVKQAFLAAKGIVEEEPKEEQPKQERCGRCRLLNPLAARFCVQCGFALNRAVAEQFRREKKAREVAQVDEDVLNDVMEDARVQAAIGAAVMERLRVQRSRRPPAPA